MHTEKQEIFDKYAKSIGYTDWKDFIIFCVDDYNSDVIGMELIEHFNIACDLVQQEQQKRILDKLQKDGKSLLYCAGVKDTILNPENLIK